MTTKITFFILILFSSMKIFGQGHVNVTRLDMTKLPKGIKYEGKITNAVMWTDKIGDNIVITTETGEYPSKTNKDKANRDAKIFAYHYISNGEVLKQTWSVYDFIKECPLDIEAKFIRNTFQVTDLNNDKIAEVWLMYKTICHGDVSPCDMKIIMYQGQQKYKMQGRNKVKVSNTQFEGGEFTFDKAFLASPKTFKDFAKKLWNKNIIQVFE